MYIGFSPTTKEQCPPPLITGAELTLSSNVRVIVSDGAISYHIPTRVSAKIEYQEGGEVERPNFLFPKTKYDKWWSYATQVLGDLSRHRVERWDDTDNVSL